MTAISTDTIFQSSHVTATHPAIIFVGNAMQFSNRMLAIFKAEFSDFDFIRVPHLTDLKSARQHGRDVCLAIFDEEFVDAMNEKTSAFAASVGPTDIVIAFSNPHCAARLLLQPADDTSSHPVGFLPLNAQLEVWVAVMRLLLCGYRFVPQEVYAAIVDAKTIADTPVHPTTDLTPREWQVLKLVADGLQNKIIAANLSLSEHTIKLHIHNLLKKIGVSNRTCAANWYLHTLSGSGPGLPNA